MARCQLQSGKYKSSEGGNITMREAEFAYINGNIYTADQKFSRVSAFAVSGDRFIAAGTSEEIRKLCTENTKIVDLEGRTVLPGLNRKGLSGHNNILDCGREAGQDFSHLHQGLLPSFLQFPGAV